MVGQLLVAVGIDANDNIYPIAYAVAELESKDSWCWFPQLLIEDFGPVSEYSWTFISDQQKVSNCFHCNWVLLYIVAFNYELLQYIF